MPNPSPSGPPDAPALSRHDPASLSAWAPLSSPVFAAIVPELVPRAQLPAALALNGVAMNASRIIGPLVAGDKSRIHVIRGLVASPGMKPAATVRPP